MLHFGLTHFFLVRRTGCPFREEEDAPAAISSTAESVVLTRPRLAAINSAGIAGILSSSSVLVGDDFLTLLVDDAAAGLASSSSLVDRLLLARCCEGTTDVSTASSDLISGSGGTAGTVPSPSSGGDVSSFLASMIKGMIVIIIR